MSGNDDDLEVYIFQGNEGEFVPRTVEKLIINPGVQAVPTSLCAVCLALRQVSLPEGLTDIRSWAFLSCENLLEITICNTVQRIGAIVFRNCKRLTKVEFDDSPSSPHQLREILYRAFELCNSLRRIKLPPSVNHVDQFAFQKCASLVEANLSTTGLTFISKFTFQCSSSLLTVSLPHTLKRIGNRAFSKCLELVTVVVPLENSQPIKIGDRSFYGCRRLANLELPRDSTAETERSFGKCRLLHERYGEDSSCIVTGLVGRFDGYSIHRMCYDHSAITVQELRKCIADQQAEGGSLVDEFGMSPFHVFLSTAEPRIELFDVLLDSLPNQILNWKDANDRRPLDYFIANWTDGNATLLQRALQKCMIDPMAHWGATSWKEEIQSKVRDVLAEHDERSRATLYDKLYSAFEHYENVEVTSILEMALWKRKLKSGWTSDGSKRQALDRDECRCLSGSDVVIPCVYGILSFG